MGSRFTYSSSPKPPEPSGSAGAGLSNFRYSGTISGNSSNTKTKSVGKFNVDLANPDKALGGTVDSAIGLAAGIGGGLLGAIGSLGFGDGRNLGATVDALGTGFEALGSVPLPSTNPDIQPKTGDILPTMLGLVGLPVRALERTVAGQRVENKGDSILGDVAQGLLDSFVPGLALHRKVEGKDAQALPPDLQERLAAGESVDVIADELVSRGAGFTNDPAQNFLGQVVFDPLNVIDFGMNVGAKFARGAALSLNEARLVGGTVGASDAFVGTMYNSWTHGMNAGQAAFAKALLGPSTAGIFHSLGTKNYQAITRRLTRMAPEYASSFEDALARGAAQLERAVAANLVEADFAAGFRRVDDMNPEAAADALLERKAFASDEVQRSVEELLDRVAPDLRGVDDLRQWSAERIAQITSAGVDDVLSNLPRKVDYDFARMVHLATYGKAGDELVEARNLIKPEELAAAGLGKDPEYLTILAPDTLTQERAVELLADLEARGAAAAADALKAYPDDFRQIANLAGEPEKLVTRMKKFIEDGKSILPTELKKPTVGSHPLPASISAWRAKWEALGYRVGFAPDDFVKVISTADGEQIVSKPFMYFASEKAPLSMRNPFGRLMDGMFRGITQTKILTASRQRMTRYAEGYGISRGEAEAFHRAVINKAVDSGTSPRGLSMLGGQPYDEIFREVLGDVRASRLIEDGVSPTWLVMKSFEGNLRQIGLTQKITGKVKVAAAERGNFVAGVTEGIYPNFRFRFSPIFQSQELIESPFWNALRGIDPVLAHDPEVVKVVGELFDILPELKYLDEASYVTHLAGSKATNAAFGPRTLVGKALRRVPNVRNAKEAQRVRQILGSIGEAFKTSMDEVNPGIWRTFEEAYGTTDPGKIAIKYMMERRALGNGEVGARTVLNDAKPANFGHQPITNAADLHASLVAAGAVDEEADGIVAIVQARAATWARQTGRSVDEWYRTRLHDISRGGEIMPWEARRQFEQRSRVAIAEQEAARLVPPPSPEAATRRLNAALNRDYAKAAPQGGKRTLIGPQERYVESRGTRMVAPGESQAKHIVGRVSKEDWVRQVEDVLTPEEFQSARYWYENLAAEFEVYGEDAPRMALAWLLSQVQASPSSGFNNVLRGLDKARGIVREGVPQAGLSEAKIVSVLKGEAPSMTAADKLHDFIDSFIGKLTRTLFRDDPRGLQPAAIDVWAARDIGFVDPAVQAWAKNEFGIDLALDFKENGAVSEAAYEYGIRFYNDIVDHLNAIGYDGGGWTAHQVQAVGWTRVIKAMGGTAEFPGDIVGKNVRRVAFNLGAGEGSPWEKIFPSFYDLPQETAVAILREYTDWLVPQVEKLTGVRILGYDTGLGFWGSYPGAGSAVLQVLGSPEAVQDAMDVIGYATRQTMMLGSRPLKSGATAGLDILGQGLGDVKSAQRLWDKLNEIAPELAHGAQPVVVEGKPGIRILRDPSLKPWNKNQVEKFRSAVDEASSELGFKVDVREGRFDTFSRSNDWTADPNGRSFLEGLHGRGVPGVATRLDDLASAAELHLTRAYRKHAPGALEDFRAQAGLDIPDSAPKSVFDLERDFVGDNPDIEYGQVFDRQGNPISNLREGTGSQVDWRGDPSLLKWEDGVLTHYHPDAATGGYEVSLSEGDVRVGIEKKLNAVRAVQSDGTVMEANFSALSARVHPYSVSKKFSAAFRKHQAAGEAYPDAIRLAAEENGIPIRVYKTSPAALENEFYQKSQGVLKGSTSIMDDGRAAIRAFEASDPSTFLHEVFHVFFYRDIREGSPRDLAKIEAYIGKAVDDFADEDWETLARLGERYVREGKAPVPELESAFASFRRWLTEIYRRIRGTEIDVKINPEIRGVLDRMLGAQDQALDDAVRAAGFGSIEDARTAVRQWDALGPQDPRWASPPPAFQKVSALPTDLRSELRGAEPPRRDFTPRSTPASPAAISRADEETIWQGFRAAFEETSRQAFKTHYFNPRRGWLERSINHPYLGIYPVSYMYGKVLPEFARFLLVRPFGLRAPLVGYSALHKLQQAVVIRIQEDPEGFGKFLEDNKDAIYLVNLLLPGDPTNLGAGAPAWARHIVRDVAEGKSPTRTIENIVPDTISNIGIGRDTRMATQVATGLLGQLDFASKAFDGIFGNGADNSQPAVFERK